MNSNLAARTRGWWLLPDLKLKQIKSRGVLFDLNLNKKRRILSLLKQSKGAFDETRWNWSMLLSQAECHGWVFNYLSYFVGFIPALHFLPLSYFPACFSVFSPFSLEVVFVFSHSLACPSLCACFGSQCFFWFCSELSISLQFYSWILIYLIWCLPFCVCCLLFCGFQLFFFFFQPHFLCVFLGPLC